ncbi:unnamed protein product [marine sediment metagenome]|uniref:Uncharacterized protein n=1 Tax=marine sediment metagenome TaxID=412755 RepID=X1VL64_9ZZZZ
MDKYKKGTDLFYSSLGLPGPLISIIMEVFARTSSINLLLPVNFSL